MSQTSRSVLVIDDDDSFRQLIASLLSPRGYQIFEAPDGREANNILTELRPVLVIVNHRLPDIDGTVWLQQFRDAGHNQPILFISGTFCDARTFSWLRNILKVTLVLQKPIAADLFLQQIEGLLPSIQVEPDLPESTIASDEGVSPIKEEYERLLSKFPGSRNYIDQAVEALAQDAEGHTEAELLDQLRQIGRKLQVENALNFAKNDYAKNLPAEWQRLSAAVAAFQDDSENGEHREKAIGIAHQLRGTAGSLGFGKVSEAASRLEKFLKTIDVTEYTESEVIWTEVFRALSDGERAVRAEAKVDPQGKEAAQTLTSGKLLALTQEEGLIKKLMLLQGRLPIEVVITETVTSTLLHARTAVFDCVVLDTRLASTKGYFDLCREIRQTEGHEEIPFAFVYDEKDVIANAYLDYVGCSIVLRTGQSEREFLEGITGLMSDSQNRKPRVLAVDDDEVLSSFIASVLASEGVVVQTLKEPIHILEKMEQFKPELVILDVLMPGLSGYDVCRLLRNKEEWRQVSILFLTSKSSAEGRTAAFQVGADDFLSKPVLTQELTDRVMAHLKKARGVRRAADKDELTGCMHRHVFFKSVENALIEGRDRRGCLCFLEIDSFDSLAKTQGALAIQKALTLIGEQIRLRFKSDVKRGRWGDKTFVLYLPGESRDEANQMIKAFAHELECTRCEGASGQFNLTVTVGLAQYPDDALLAKELIEQAYRSLGLAIVEKHKAILT